MRTNSLGQAILNTGTARDSMGLDNGGHRNRVGVGVAEALQSRDNRANSLLLNAASWCVTEKKQAILVRGEVNLPTPLVASGKNLGAYPVAVGGTTKRGRVPAVCVTQPSSKIESRTRLLWRATLDPIHEARRNRCGVRTGRTSAGVVDAVDNGDYAEATGARVVSVVKMFCISTPQLVVIGFGSSEITANETLVAVSLNSGVDTSTICSLRRVDNSVAA